MGTDSVEKGISAFIAEQPRVEGGYALMEKIASRIGVEVCFPEQEFLAGYAAFDQALLVTFNEEMMGKNIRALQFSLHENEYHEVEVRFFGSNEWDEDTEEWRHNMSYYPKQNMTRLDIFLGLVRAHTHIEEAFLAMAVITCYINTFASENGDVFFENRRSGIGRKADVMHFAAGFDDGRLYHIGKVMASQCED